MERSKALQNAIKEMDSVAKMEAPQTASIVHATSAVASAYALVAIADALEKLVGVYAH